MYLDANSWHKDKILKNLSYSLMIKDCVSKTNFTICS